MVNLVVVLTVVTLSVFLIYKLIITIKLLINYFNDKTHVYLYAEGEDEINEAIEILKKYFYGICELEIYNIKNRSGYLSIDKNFKIVFYDENEGSGFKLLNCYQFAAYGDYTPRSKTKIYNVNDFDFEEYIKGLDKK